MRLRTRAVAGDFKLHASHFFCDALGFFEERGPNSLAAVGLVHNEFKDLSDARRVVQLVFKAQVQYGACGGICFFAGDKSAVVRALHLFDKHFAKGLKGQPTLL